MINVNTVTVLGANGSMGKNISAIFASFGDAKVYLACRTIEKANQAVIDAYNSVRAKSIRENLVPITYNDLEDAIRESDLIFESLKEDFDIKIEMLTKIKPFLKKNAVIASGTSGLSIKKLAEVFDYNKDNFFGIHMFNPPYNLTLCELILHSESQIEKSIDIENYLTTVLKRSVVKVKDEPAFLGNRIGFFFINEALKLADENTDEGGIDYIDAILGCYIGRNMAPLATAEFVGLDVTKAIEDYIYNNSEDEFKNSFLLPNYVNELIESGYIGKKVKRGLFYYDNDTKLKYVYDIKQKIYRTQNNYQFYFSNEMIKHIKNGNYENAISVLLGDKSHEATICKKMILKYVLYSIYITKIVAFDINACDVAMANGFSWLPPLAWIKLLGGINKVTELTKEYLDSNWINLVEKKDFFKNVPKESKYDYRSYLKAKY